MQIAIVGLGLLVSVAAFAERQSGNFRRGEALEAAGVKKGHVVSYKQSKKERVLLVEHNNKVDLIKAPLDHSQPVEKITKADGKRLEVMTQDQARELASHNGGAYGSKRKVKVAPMGLAASGDSYKFLQTSPASIKAGNFRASNIQRTVTVGTAISPPAESASATLIASPPIRSINP